MPLFFPNFAAEERDVAPPPAWPTPTLTHLDAALRSCCEGDRSFADLHGRDVVVAWLNTATAAGYADARGVPLWGAPPSVVDVVHDKAFCVAVARAHGLWPAHLDAAVHVIDEGALSADALLALAQLPPTAAGLPHRGFTAKPRRGSAGRGRVDLRNTAAVPGALARLRAAGGCVVEPWLQRTVDVAAAWRIDEQGGFALLGTSRAIVNGAGVWRACEVVIDDEGVPRSATAWEGALVAQSAVVVSAAAARGLRGPCGVDAFAFVDVDGHERLRVVELNARFTAGLLGVVLARGRATGTRWRFAPAQVATLVAVDGHDADGAAPRPGAVDSDLLHE
ncbi:MAG: hypothetical protein FJ137_17330 [Deltaproteobacteria bacterium]|nr:hypothetical protein [Deltaproteobacteria bacterium]